MIFFSGLSSGGGASASAKPVLLDSFFPFDPYALKSSESHISEEYRVYKGAVIGDGESSDEEEDSDEDDDERMEEDGEEDEDELGMPMPAKKRRRLESTSSAKNSSLISSLLYGTSPGFKH